MNTSLMTPHFEGIELNVHKYGGTSMLDIPVVAQRISEDPNCRVFTSSAFGNNENDDLHQERVTTELTRLGKLDPSSSDAVLLRDGLVERHVEQARRLGLSELGVLADQYTEWFKDAEGSLDFTKYLGERMSTDILCRYMGAIMIDALDVIIFNDRHSQIIDINATSAALRARMTDKNATYGVPGFGGSFGGVVRTLPWSGTDRTGSIVTRALGGSTYTNSKEIDGVRTSDPRYVGGTQLLSHITYHEAREFGNANMTVLMRDVILDLAGTGVVTYVRNTFNPSAPGTKISEVRDSSDDELLIGVGARDNLAYEKAQSYGMNEVNGSAARVLQEVAGFRRQEDGSGGVSVDYAPMGTDAVDVVYQTSQFEDLSFTIDDFRAGLREQLSSDFTMPVTSETHRLGALHLIGQAQGLNGMTRTRVQAIVNHALLENGIPTFGETGGIREASSVILINPEDYSRARSIAHEAFFGPTR